MGFLSKPSSSSTLNHHEPHNPNEYMDLSSHFNDDSSPYIPSGSQKSEATPVSQTRSMGNGFHNHPVELPAPPSEPVCLETAPMNNQQETPDERIYNNSQALLGSTVTASPLPPPVSTSLVESQKQEALNRPSPKAANDEGDLETSALPINPTLRESGTSSGPPAIHLQLSIQSRTVWISHGQRPPMTRMILNPHLCPSALLSVLLGVLPLDR
jgi:hypothetical protein